MNLKEKLFHEYGLADKRFKHITKSNNFKIDDQGPGDNDRFCGIFVETIDDDNFKLSLSNNAPINDEIEQFIRTNGGIININELYSHIEITININNISLVDQLANLINNAIKKKYSNSNWVWICPRTSKSLRKLYNLLK